MSNKHFYVTTPIYYVNDKPHIGSAYTTVACDVLARFKRLDGYDVMFLTGTDEHGMKIKRSAEKAGCTPQQLVDQVSENFRQVWPQLNISNDDFIRTTEPRHKEACKVLWEKLVQSGDIYLGSYAGWYAVSEEAYYNEDELKEGPEGKKISPFGAVCEWVEEECYFFRLSAWQDRLLKLYEDNPDMIAPESRRNEVISFVSRGLKDFAVSRTTFDWGIPVPGGPGHVMYVWIDALTNYISAIGYPDENNEKFKKFWPADLHMVGKDILRFHAVYWPAFLMAAGVKPPQRVFAHGWLTVDGQKMSKSLGNFIPPHVLIERYGVDGARYGLLRGIPFGSDGDFSHALVIQRINNDLANGLGNLAQRTLSFIAKNCTGILPIPGELAAQDKVLLEKAQVRMLPGVRLELDRQRFDRAIELIMEVVSDANVYIDGEAPWTLKKTDPERMKTVLYVLTETIRCLALIMQPFIPASAEKLLDQLALPSEDRTFEKLAANGAITPGCTLPPPIGIFPRITTDEAPA